ncbi:MAG: hypothetical protein LUC88_01140, partial [Prevotella sp.]|nr:hypothetical protein [Prevotella sp.]
MEEIHTKLILKSCEDYGMQSGNNLILLKKERFVMRISHRPTVYLLDKHGRIVCTIVNNQLEYESENNQDRRYQNTRNGFVVEWSNDGSICTVTCTVRRRKFSIDCLKPPYRKRTLLIASLLFLICLIGVLVYNFTPNSTELIARGVFEFDDKYGEEIESVKFSEDSEWL